MKYKWSITGIDCPSCAAKLAEQMEKTEGVTSAKINFLSERLTVESELEKEALFATLSIVAKRFSPEVRIEE